MTTITLNNTPQAKDDLYTVTMLGGIISEDGGTSTLNVMANDLGGKAKSLYSLDDGFENEGSATSADLLTRDVVGFDNTSKAGALIEITADGKVSYSMTAASVAKFQSLAEGEIGLDTFTYAIRLGNGTLSSATVTVQIKGTNDVPVITSMTQSGSVKEDGTLTATGTVTSSDVDNGATATYSGNATGSYGSFAVAANTGVWTYTLANAAHQNLAEGETKSETFKVTVTDDKGATATQNVTLTITGTNDVPIVVADTNAGNEDSTITGTVASNDSDVDNGAVLSYGLNASVDGLTLNTDGSYSFDAGNAAYQSLAQGATMDVVADYTVTDEHGASSTSTLTITLTGTNDAPIAVADTNAGNEDTTITGTVTSNDSDVDTGAVLSYSLNAEVAGLTLNSDGSYSFDASNAAYQSLAKDDTTDVVAEYTVTDEFGATSTSTLTITLTGTSDAPPPPVDPIEDFRFNSGGAGGKFPGSGDDNTAEGFTNNDTLTFTGYGNYETLTIFEGLYGLGNLAVPDTKFVIVDGDGHAHHIHANHDGHDHVHSGTTDTGYLVDYTDLTLAQIDVTSDSTPLIAITGIVP